MVGMVRFAFRGGTAEAVLGDNGRWSCATVPCLVRPLDILHSPHWEGLPARGLGGRRNLSAAGRWLKGVVVLGTETAIPGIGRQAMADPTALSRIYMIGPTTTLVW